MAPELAFHARGADLRSAVYALGILLYELVVGKPPFAGANPSDVLRQQLTEIPPRLSVARGDGSINEDLDQIVEMMLAKAPDSRFQAPAAIIGALSSLLGSSPMELAPPIERDEEQEENDHYSTIEMSSVDRDAIPGLGLPDRNMHTILTPAAINQKRVDEEEAGDDSGPMKTLMMGSAAAVPDEGFSRTTSGSGIFKVVKIGKVEEIVDMSQDVGPTRPTNPLPMGTEEEPLEEPDAKQVEVSPAVEDQAPPEPVAEVVTQAEAKLDDEVVAPAATTETAPEEERVAEAAVPAAAETPSVEVSMEAEKEKEEKSPKREEKTSKKDKRDKKTSSKPVVALSKEDTATAKKGPSEIGSIAAKNPDTDTDNWFAATSDNAWNDSMAVDLAEEVETKNQKVLWGIGIALILGALGFIIWTQFIYEAEEPVKDPVEEVAKQPAVDVGELAQKFDEAMREGRIISPIGNSAMARLEEMKRHAPDGPEFAKARGEFVKRSREEAVAAFEAENVGLARNYAGYASQFAPEDTELKALAERYQAEFVKTIEVPSFDRDPNAIPEADAGNEQAADVAQAEDIEPVIETPPVVEEKPVEKVEKPVEKVAKPIEKVEKPKDSPKLNLKTMSDTDSKANTEKLSEARAAYSRGDLSRAQNLYLELVKSDAGNHQVHAGLGQVYFDRALYNDAVKHQQQALKLKPGRADYQINLGQSYYRLGRFQDAINVWEEVLKKDPNNKNAKQYIELAKRRLN
jgi:tetratricopeptide (TPR) repeat protein